MVDADAPVDLVMKANLPVGNVLVSGELDPVHSQVRPGQAGMVGILGVDLGQSDEWPAVGRPRLDRRQAVDRRLVLEDRPAAGDPGPEMPECPGQAPIAPGPACRGARVHLQLDQPANRIKGIAEEEPGPIDRPEQVGHQGESGPLDPGEIERRAARLVDPPLDGRGFEMRIDLLDR